MSNRQLSFFVVAARDIEDKELYLNYTNIDDITGLPTPFFTEKINEATFFDPHVEHGTDAYAIITDPTIIEHMRDVARFSMLKEIYSKMIYLDVGGLCSDIVRVEKAK